MSVATLLTQPKLVTQLNNLSAQDTLAEDLMALVRRILLDTEKSQVILQSFQRAFEQFGQGFVGSAPNFNRGLEQLGALFAPFINSVRAFGESPDLRGDFGPAVEFIANQFTALMNAVAQLNINSIRDFVTRFLQIMLSQFGFSLDTLVERTWGIFDAVMTDLRTLPASTDAQEKELRLVTASLLGRVKRELQEQVELPTISADDIAAVIMEQFRELGLDTWVQQANQIADAIKSVCLAAGSIGDLLKVGGSVGAAAKTPDTGDTYAWYASWLLATRNRDIGETIGNFFILNPSDEVWATADKTQVVWRTVFDGDLVLHEGSNLKWNDAPMFNSATGAEYVLFPHISADAMEFLAHFTYALVELGKGIWNSVDAAEAGDRASAITHLIWNFFNSGFGALGEKPFISYLLAASALGQGHQGWMNAIFPIVGTTLPSLEGRQTEADEAKFAFWGILFADDVLERAGHHLLLNTVRDLLLSTLTLINNIGQAQGTDASHPINKQYTSTWATVGAMICTIIYLKKWYNKADYKYPFNGFLWTFASMLAGLVGGLSGTLTASLWSIGFDVKSFFVDIAMETIKPFFLHYVNLYSWIENDTKGGTFNGSRPAFAGYPEKSDSPYRLPWETGVTRACVQGNMGMWSHFDASDQIYAVDFGFDQAEVIHAARGGTVVGFRDTVPNDTHDQGWNYIVIRHDHASETNTVRQKHDKYHDGTAYVTYGVYGHGRTNGVTEVFAARGIAAGSILGSVVQQGDTLMKAGNTGESFHNHLHFHVKNNGEALGTAAPAGNLNPSTLSSNSMPFVFRDVDGDGVVKSLTFYTASNV